jgi:hypothetical protein
MGIYRAHLAKRLGPVTFCLSLPFVALGLAMDALAQFTFASAIFWQWPHLTFAPRVFTFWGQAFVVRVPSGDWLVTARLQRYVAQGSGWRFTIANWVCNNLLDVFDPSGDHC